MNKIEAFNIMWRNVNDTLPRMTQIIKELQLYALNRVADKSGDSIKELLREIIELYTRLGVIAALEEIE